MTTPEHTRALPKASITGEVSGASRPLAGAAVTLTDSTGSQAARAVADEDGRFRIEDLAPGMYVAIVSRPGFRPQAESLRVLGPGVNAEFDLEAATAVHGTVRDNATGNPVALAAVTALGANGEVLARAVSDLDGAYRIDGLDATAVTLVAAGAGVDPVAVPVHLGDGDRIVDLAVGTHSPLNGILTLDGHPVGGLVLVLRDARGREVGTSRTGPDGSYRFEDLPPGEYTITSVTGRPRVTSVPAGVTVADVTLPTEED